MAKDTRKGDRHSPGYMAQYRKSVYEQINIRVRKDSGIAQALDNACHMAGLSKAEYVSGALVDRLKQEGFLPKE